MTRDEITTLVTTTTGQFDTGSVTLCNLYIQRAYEMVWNLELWKDTVDVDTTGTITAGNNSFNLPTGFERVVSLQILSGGVPVGMLEPTTTGFILQTEPNALTTNGVPTKYEEYTAGGVRKIRIFPKADASYTFTMHAKRICPTLSGSDSSIIRNIDNALIALAEADMYTRQRQLGKAAEMAKKAGAFVEEARAIEKQQANQPRAAKQLPDAANSLAAMADSVSALTGEYSPQSMIVIKEFLRRNYQQVWDSNLWAESTMVIDKASVTGVLVLPASADRVISVRGNSSLGQVAAVQPSIYYGVAPSIFEQTGDPLAFSYLTSVAVATLPLSAEKLSIKNSSDTAVQVYVRGETDTAGTVEQETVNCTGGGAFTQTVGLYITPLTISKPYTSASITVQGYVSGTTFVIITGEERERKHIRIWFQPTPTSDVTCKVLCKRRINPLVTDNDTPLLRDVGNVLINLAASDMFMKLGNKDGAMDCRGKAGAALKTLIDLETNQGANSATVVPEVEYNGGYGGTADYDDWIVAKI